MRTIASSLLLCLVLSLSAKVSLPPLFSEGMLLQRDTKARIWGKARPNASIELTVSWNNKKIKTTTDPKGAFQIEFPTPAAQTGAWIELNDGEALRLTNIALGDLWICSGQSNMEMLMKGFKNQPVAGSLMATVHSKDDEMRLFTVKRSASFSPQIEMVGQWSSASPATVSEFSAVGYYFGRIIRQVVGVPIGLIHTSWGGSSIEAWMASDWLKAFPKVKIPAPDSNVRDKNRTPTMLYNGMIHPLAGLAICGAIWYQGESNYERSDEYADLFTAMVRHWRDVFRSGEFPFFYCQIAPYDYQFHVATGTKPINSALLREAQYKAEAMIPNCGMAVLLDAGDSTCIHPAAKQIAGERLALLALSKTYKIDGIACESPRFKEMICKGDTCILAFDRAPMWLCAPNGRSKLFEIAGSNRVFYPADARIVRSKIEVSSPKVKNPVAVRYAFRNYLKGDLFTPEGLPVSSFRTDNW